MKPLGHRIRFRQKGRQRSSVLFGRRNWMTHGLFTRRDGFKKSFWKNMVVDWCGVNRMIIYFSKESILPSTYRLFYSSFSSNHPKNNGLYGIQFRPRPAATTFAFLSAWVLFYALSSLSKWRSSSSCYIDPWWLRSARRAPSCSSTRTASLVIRTVYW